MIELRFNNGGSNVSRVIHESESSYRYRSLMNKTSLQLKFSLPEYIEFPVGTTCEFQNETFTLLAPPTIKKNGERDIEFTLNMGNDEEHLSRYKLRNNEDGRLKWSMTAKPEEFLRQIVLNLNRRDGEGVWSVGTCLDATEKTIEFNHVYLLDALQSVADEFETEWEIVDHTISLHKVEYFKDSPVALSYGKGNGFVSGVGRSSSTDAPPVEILYVQGGEQNIDYTKYGSRSLLLPKGQELEYEGKRYKASSDGLSIQRADKEPRYNNEDSVELTEIYPKRVGTATAVEVESVEKNFYDIIDAQIPENLDYNKYLIEGESEMTFIFQSGMLAGREFEVKYKHSERRFKLVPQEFDGVIMPSETFKPKVGDTYAIFGIMLPDEYICNNETQEGASWDMFREAARYMHDNEEQKFTFTGTLQGIWAKRNWLAVGGKLKVGGYVYFSDNQFAPDGVDIRIVGIKDFLYNPYAPTIELTNESSGGASMSSTLNKIARQEVVIEENKREVTQYTKRRFNDVKDTISMLEAAMGGYTDSISPLSVQTMSMLVGDESLQFKLEDAKENQSTGGGSGYADGSGDDIVITERDGFSSEVWDVAEGSTLELRLHAISSSGDYDMHVAFATGANEVVDFLPMVVHVDESLVVSKVVRVPEGASLMYISFKEAWIEVYEVLSEGLHVVYDNENKTLSCAKRRLTHLTLGNKSISGGEKNLAECPQWVVGEYVSPTLTDEKAMYYLYARCSKDNNQGIYLLSEEPIGMEAVDGFYHFLIGVLNAESNGTRSFVTLYGFTEILPSRITTERIVSADGRSVIDLAGNSMHLGGGEASLDWNRDEAGTLVLSNATIKNALKVIGMARLAGFKISDNVIQSEKEVQVDSSTLPSFTLDGKNGKIEMHSRPSSSGMTPTLPSDTYPTEFIHKQSTILLSANNGCLSVENEDGVSYVSASGVFCNNPQTKISSTLGTDSCASIVGFGFGKDVNKRPTEQHDETFVSGVYGFASNTGNAPAYGGYFVRLRANGLILGFKYIGDNSASQPVELDSNVSQVVGLTNSGKTGQVILPTNATEGQVIWIKQIGAGAMTIKPNSSQTLLNSISNKLENGITINSAGEYKFTFVKYYVESEAVNAWFLTKVS